MRPSAGGWLFFALVFSAWAAAAWFAPAVATASGERFLEWMATAAPVLGVVLLAMFLVELWLDQERIQRYLGRASGWCAYAIAVTLGIVATGPTYAWYALARNLKDQGVPPGLVAAFLYALGVKLPLLPLLVHFFGAAYAVVLTLWMVAFSIAIGLVVGWLCAGQVSHPPHSAPP